MNVDLANEEHTALLRLVKHTLGLWCRDDYPGPAQAPHLREAGSHNVDTVVTGTERG